jgi:hypothetical protein
MNLLMERRSSSPIWPTRTRKREKQKIRDNKNSGQSELRLVGAPQSELRQSKHFLLFRDVPSKFIWKPLLQDVVGPSLCNKIVKGVLAKININYPEMAPWSVLDREPEHPALSLQVYRGGKRQPFHLDSAAEWYLDGVQPWAPLSVIVNMNDGWRTFTPGAPMFGLFNCVRRKTPKQAVTALQKIFEMWESAFREISMVKSRAGQILAFHPGEQFHCGLGSDYKCSLTGHLFTGRVVLFLSCVPHRVLDKVKDLPLFNSESPWGLQRGGITICQVDLFVCRSSGSGFKKRGL